MKLKSLLLMLSCLAFLAGCNELEGNLQVNQALQIMKDGKLDETIPRGNYELDVKNKDSKRRLEIKLEDSNGDDYKFKYTYPKNFNFPENGSFRIAASTSNQMYDLEGYNTTDVTTSPVRRDYESCYTNNPGYDCFYDQFGRRFCRPFQRRGYRQVEYRDVRTVRSIDASLVSGSKVVANMTAGRTDTSREYLYQGFCR